MNEMQWDEKQYAQLTKRSQGHPDILHYLETRHLPAKKPQVLPAPAPPPSPAQNSGVAPYTSPADAGNDLVVEVAKGAVVLSIAGGVVYVVVTVVVMAVGAAFAFVSANAVAIGGGIFAVAAFILGINHLFGRHECESASGQPSQGAPIINVTVNVAGQTVTTNNSH